MHRDRTRLAGRRVEVHDLQLGSEDPVPSELLVQAREAKEGVCGTRRPLAHLKLAGTDDGPTAVTHVHGRGGRSRVDGGVEADRIGAGGIREPGVVGADPQRLRPALLDDVVAHAVGDRALGVLHEACRHDDLGAAFGVGEDNRSFNRLGGEAGQAQREDEAAGGIGGAQHEGLLDPAGLRVQPQIGGGQNLLVRDTVPVDAAPGGGRAAQPVAEGFA